MPQKIVLMVDDIRVIAELRETPTAEAIVKALPVSGETQRWGGELYFPVPVSVPLEADSRESLLPGELGYWPEGDMFCIFFGATPASEGDEIRPASAVNVFGRLIGRWSPIKQVPAGKTIRVELLTEGEVVETSEPDLTTRPVPAPDSMYSPTSFAGEVKKEPEVEAAPQPIAEEAPKTYTPTPMPESALFEPKPADIIRASAAEPEVVEEAAEPVSTPEEVVEAAEAVVESQAETHEEIPTTIPAEKVSMIKSILSDKKKIWGIVEGVVILILIAVVGMQLGRAGNGTLKTDMDNLRKDVDAQKQAMEALGKTVTQLQADVKTTANATQESIIKQLPTRIDERIKAPLIATSQQLAAMQRQLNDGAQGTVWVKNPANNHSYCISPVALPWHQARDAAKKMGGYLATLTDAKENEWVVANFGEQTEYWIGLNDEQENRKWAWANGEKFEFANWAPGEPDNYRKNQHYVVINYIVPDKGQLEPGRWKDAPSNEIHLAIIERDI
jgi:hypothetical protein